MTDPISALIATFGLILTAAGLFFAGSQLRATKTIAEGDFLLRLDDAMQKHWQTHVRLRPGGEWTKDGGSPSTVEDWASVESYMGLFERIKVMLDKKLLELETFDRLYGYRILNIVANDSIREAKLERNKDGWKDFIALVDAIQKNRARKGSNR